MLKNVRIWFSKTGAACYISHLDLTRCMSRALRRAGLPVWYTEGFSPRILMGFAVPLSLGFESPRESMDIRLLEEVPAEELLKKLNDALPPDIRAFDVTDPVQSVNDIAFADYRMMFSGMENPAEVLRGLLAQEKIEVMKHSKKGPKPVDIRPFFAEASLEETDAESCELRCVLPAGNNGGINPMLLAEALKNAGYTPRVHVERRALLDANHELFR